MKRRELPTTRSQRNSRPSLRKGEKSRLVPSVVGAMRILDFIGTSGRAIGRHVHLAVGMNASTTHQILKTLVHGGYLHYEEETKQYTLGPVLTALGAASSSNSQVGRIARPYMRRWVRETAFTAFLARELPDHSSVIVDKVESTLDIKTTLEVGQRFPSTAGAIGKAFMAWLPEAELKEILSSDALKPFTATSIRERAQWLQELERVRKLGWAESRGEHNPSNNAVAAPIRSPHGEVVLVVGSLASRSDMADERLGHFGQAIQQVAERIAAGVFGTALGNGGQLTEQSSVATSQRQIRLNA